MYIEGVLAPKSGSAYGLAAIFMPIADVFGLRPNFIPDNMSGPVWKKLKVVLSMYPTRPLELHFDLSSL